MNSVKSICVFLGSSPGNHPAYMKATSVFGHELARRGITCVYGGSRTGLMLQLAESVLEAGGQIIGVTVQALRDREDFHTGLTTLHVVPTMAERKTLMIDLAEGFVALPGGIGTFDEFFEVYTLRQLGFHSKPCGLLDVNGYFEPLTVMLDRAEHDGFMKGSYRDAVVVEPDPSTMIDLLVAAGKQ